MQLKHLSYILFIAFTLLAFSACRENKSHDAAQKDTVQTASRKKEKKTTSKTHAASSDKQVKTLIKELQKQETDYQTLEGKVSATIQTGTNKISSKANLRIIKDEMLMLSVQPLLGIEMFRVIVTPQQVTYIDRINQYYFQESIEKLTGDLKSVFNFHVLQALFTNRLFLLSKETVDQEDAPMFYLNVDGENQTTLHEKRNLSTVLNYFTFDEQQRIVGNYIGDREETIGLKWQYDQFDKLTSQTDFPFTMNLQADYDKQTIKLYIRFNSISLDKKLTVSEEIPKRYKQITLKQLTHLISTIK